MQKCPINYWWTDSIDTILKLFNVNSNIGLDAEQVLNLRNKFGSNTIYKIKQASIFDLIKESVAQPMIVLLAFVSILSFVFGKYIESMVMLFIIGAYVLVELINNYRATRIMEALKGLTSPECLVLRNGQKQNILCEEIVVGDIILLYPGTFIPADARLISSAGLMVDESALTGESLSVLKNEQVKADASTPLFERYNSVFAGTQVKDGEAKAIVTCVGKGTEFGKILGSIDSISKEQTVLQKSMIRLAKVLAVFALVISFIIPILGYLRGYSLQEMILLWLALTFLMVPGQPPIIITMALALASLELAKKNILVKNLRGAEVIGFVNTIVSDKTGTLTKNKIEPELIINSKGQKTEDKDILKSIWYSLPRYFTDSTDKAVYNFSPKAIVNEFESKLYNKEKSPVLFKSFSYYRPWRIITYKFNNKYKHYITGKAEDIIQFSNLDKNNKDILMQILDNYANMGRRLTAFAQTITDSPDLVKLENLNFIAIAVLKDPLRVGVKDAFNKLRNAGIDIFIVTGDHKTTLKSIAQELNISINVNKEIVVGSSLKNLDKDKLNLLLQEHNLFARVSPHQKLNIVNNLRNQNKTIVVIGDGINDVPALNAANVSIAMGESGTQVAREVSDLILVDDNFANVPAAIIIGRKFLDNFKKGLTYYLTSKFILLLLFIIPLVIGIPFPLLPIHIILIELIMDLASSTVFISEPAEPGLLHKKYFKNIKNFISLSLVGPILFYGAPIAISILAFYIMLYVFNYNLLLAQTVVFCTWIIGHIFLALNMKQRDYSLFSKKGLKNRVGFFWLLAMIVFTFTITNFSFFHEYLQVTYIPFSLWILIFIVGFFSTSWISILHNKR